MLFDWSITTTVVELAGRNDTGRGSRCRERQAATAPRVISAAPRASRMRSVRRRANRSCGASASGTAGRRRHGSRSSSSRTVAIGPFLELPPDGGGERARSLRLGRRRRPRELRGCPRELTAPGSPKLDGEKLQRLALLCCHPTACTVDGVERQLETRAVRRGTPQRQLRQPGAQQPRGQRDEQERKRKRDPEGRGRRQAVRSRT